MKIEAFREPDRFRPEYQIHVPSPSVPSAHTRRYIQEDESTSPYSHPRIWNKATGRSRMLAILLASPVISTGLRLALSFLPESVKVASLAIARRTSIIPSTLVTVSSKFSPPVWEILIINIPAMARIRLNPSFLVNFVEKNATEPSPVTYGTKLISALDTTPGNLAVPSRRKMVNPTVPMIAMRSRYILSCFVMVDIVL